LDIRGTGVNRSQALDVALEPGQIVELGRLDVTRTPAEQLFVPVTAGEIVRIPVAAATQLEVSRRQLRIQSGPDGTVRLTNLSDSIAVPCADRPALTTGETVDRPLPIRLRLGDVAVSLSRDEQAKDEDASLGTLERATSFPARQPDDAGRAAGIFLRDIPLPALESLVCWWRDVIEVLQSASNSEDFFQKAARALVRLVGLDLGAVLLTEKRTFFSQPDETADVLTSLAALDSFVAAPILDRDDRVIGALYGHRSRGLTQADGAGITRLEALLVETLACGVAAGLARLEQQRAAMARKVQFDQFFSAELSTELEAQPDLLAGRDTEVTVLFCDIRGFSRVSECLGPTHTMEWIGDVLSALSDEVVATGGVLVDYIGDAVLAMWGAPQRQPDHALRACRTARAMVRQAGPINTRWKPRLGASCSFGVGVNSAVARVGNIGSTRKFKYGPLGNGVNLGSRVEGATKYLRVPALVTGATRRLVGNEFHTRRLCTVRVVNIVEPVELHELDCTDEPMRRELFARYEEALEAFEQGDFRSAARMLGNLLAAVPGDGPSLVLLSRAVECMVHEPADFSPVWQLPGK
jgi:adenylate cyclase